MSASVREVVSAVSDKLGSQDDLLLVHLSSAGGECETHTHFKLYIFSHFKPGFILCGKNVYLNLVSASLYHFNFQVYLMNGYVNAV